MDVEEQIRTGLVQRNFSEVNAILGVGIGCSWSTENGQGRGEVWESSLGESSFRVLTYASELKVWCAKPRSLLLL